MEENDRYHRSFDLILRLPGLIMLELLYLEAITLNNWILLINFTSHWNIDILLYILAWLLLLLPRKTLSHLYASVISLSSIALSHYILRQLLLTSGVLQSDDLRLSVATNVTSNNASWLDTLSSNKKILNNSVTVILSQLTLVLFSCKIINAKPVALSFFLLPLYPWLTCLFTSRTLVDSIGISYLLTCITMFLYHFKYFNIVAFQTQMKIFWIKIQLIVRVFGWQGVITWAQDEFQVQRLLITCWFLRYFAQLTANIYHNFDFSKLDRTVFEDLDIIPFDYTSQLYIVILLFFTAVQCLTTTINLFGLGCIIKNVVKLQFFLTRSWLHWSFRDHPPDSVSGPLTGVIDGITLLIMTLYTDVLNTDVEGRFILMIYIIFTIASSQFQSMFNIIDPILMTLATAHNGSMLKHTRTVMFALFLLLTSGFLSYISFFVMRSTFWVFIVAYNYVNTFSLMLGSLSIYCILMIDYLTLRGWTSLDDVMFYIRGACRAVEFCVTLCMCGYIMMTFYSEMTSFAGIVMLAVYTYYCIVQRGGKGWRIWQMRRQAASKVRSLVSASPEMLKSQTDNLCPICYQSMDSNVRIMHCNHHFHENCLKKWFYIQDKCPMCNAEFKPHENDQT